MTLANSIHDAVDKIVPLEASSGLMKTRNTALGGSPQLMIPQGRNMWKGFSQCGELVAFVKTHSKPTPNRETHSPHRPATGFAIHDTRRR